MPSQFDDGTGRWAICLAALRRRNYSTPELAEALAKRDWNRARDLLGLAIPPDGAPRLTAEERALVIRLWLPAPYTYREQARLLGVDLHQFKAWRRRVLDLMCEEFIARGQLTHVAAYVDLHERTVAELLAEGTAVARCAAFAIHDRMIRTLAELGWLTPEMLARESQARMEGKLAAKRVLAHLTPEALARARQLAGVESAEPSQG